MTRVAAADPAVLSESPAGAGTNLAAPAGTAAALAADRDRQLRSDLKLQEQLHAALLAIEQARQESSLESRSNAEALASRLDQFETSMGRQREQRWQSLQESNRIVFMLAGSVIGLGLLAFAGTAYFQSRGMNRLADIASQICQERAMTQGMLSPMLPAQAEPLLLGSGSAGITSRALLGTIEQLQQRIRELERTAHPELPFGDALVVGLESRSAALRNGGGGDPRAVDHVSALVGKGQVLLSLGQAEEALACFDQAIAEAPGRADSHLRRGQVLEKLKRLDEAVASYDRAIGLNRHLTQAYLSKGAVFNQQERYNEALACYELALNAETRS